jgi:hypothetical protein
MRRAFILNKEKGLSTESALFTLASDAIHEHAQEFISKLDLVSKLGSAAQHEIHLHIKRNGEIKYRALVKE